MKRDLPERSREEPHPILDGARAALDQGSADEARELALSVLAEQNGTGSHLEARALAFLAHCDRLGSRLRRASESSRRAAQLFERLGDAQGEANALTILAHVAMLLGRNDESVEAALLAVSLCDDTAPQPQDVLAHNCLGLAYAWSGDHERADASLEKAVQVARGCEPPISVYQPRLNQIWVEASRLLEARYQSGELTDLSRMEALVQECWRLEEAGNGTSILPGMKSMGRTISLASSALLAAWQRDLVAAKRGIAEATESLPNVKTWMDAFVRWCEAEVAWAEQDWPKAERAFVEMREIGFAVEHEQLACRAHLVLAQVFEAQGKHAEARAEHRALRQRERRVTAESLISRESLVSWRLGARQSERHLRQALVVSKQFERWSLEDALTGIANRRHFEQALADRLALATSAGRPLAVAMVDVDKFKTVNDRFTHQVGDRVLKTVAAIVASQVRAQDLPARWAGDEFVILFDDTPQAMAQQVCERIRAAVADFDWGSVAPGLSLSVSIGLSEASAGDDAESVLHRSDQSMYRTKPPEPAGS